MVLFLVEVFQVISGKRMIEFQYHYFAACNERMYLKPWAPWSDTMSPGGRAQCPPWNGLPKGKTKPESDQSLDPSTNLQGV